MKKELWIVVFVSFVNALSISLIVPVMYAYGRSFNLNEFQISLLLTLFSAFQFLATPIIGRLSDYHGRKWLLAISLFGTCLSNILAFLAPTAMVLYLARILDGVTGGNNSVAQAVISDITEPKDRAKAFGMFGAAFGLAFIVGPLISIPLQSVSLATPFLASAVAALIATLLTIFFLPETLKTPERKKITLRDLGFVDIFTGFARPQVGTVLALSFFATLIFGIFQFGFQPYVMNVLSATAQQVSLILLLYGVMSVIVQMKLVPLFVKKLGYFGSLVLSFIGTITILSLFLVPTNFWYFLALAPFFALFAFLSRPILSAIVSTNSRPEDQGIALGLMESYGSLALTIGPLLGGLVATSNLGYPFYAAAGAGVVALLFAVSNRQIFHVSAKNRANF